MQLLLDTYMEVLIQVSTMDIYGQKCIALIYLKHLNNKEY